VRATRKEKVKSSKRIQHLIFLFSLWMVMGALGEEFTSRKIVVFQDEFASRSAQDRLLFKSGAWKHKSIPLINGAVVEISSRIENKLKQKEEILRIDDDLILSSFQTYALDKKKDENPQPYQLITWNIYQIGADLAWSTTEGDDVKVAICDTGIDLDHPDLSENIAADVNLIKPKKSGDDDSGHGTLVAGIVAAVDNKIGIVGVGPKIALCSVKILDKNGKGWLSDLIDAFDWCVDNEIDVINMSFGTLETNTSFQEAVKNVYDAGIVLVAAAGNDGQEGGNIFYPARYPETIAVSAVDELGCFAPFSSYGAEIDIAAPGVDIKSTYENGGYDISSGTSLAAPHVAATAALILTTSPHGPIDENRNRVWDPFEVKVKLMLTAESLGLPADLVGAGLVRANKAIK
jgi:subtilisin